ncbi:hypothetical protein Dip510_001877 [Elusimicrobium posterum]|uniref:hypothetical protein n=1 Tax=Elusimicrobium posterum TaxID=3116653 RepID=UPI003C72101D
MYLENFWLSDKEYFSRYANIFNKFFEEKKEIPEMVFKGNHKIFLSDTGAGLAKEDFEKIKKIMKITKDSFFFMIQNYNEEFPLLIGKDNIPALKFKFKYPHSVSYEEMNPNYGHEKKIEGISFDSFVWSYRHFYIFGDSGKWAAYSAPDWEYPFIALVCDPEYLDLFEELFRPSKEDVELIKEGVPPEYKQNSEFALPIKNTFSKTKSEAFLSRITENAYKRYDGIYILKEGIYIKVLEEELCKIIQIHNPRTGIENVIFLK